MTFDEILQTDVDSVFMNAAEFAEAITVRPETGSNYEISGVADPARYSIVEEMEEGERIFWLPKGLPGDTPPHVDLPQGAELHAGGIRHLVKEAIELPGGKVWEVLTAIGGAV